MSSYDTDCPVCGRPMRLKSGGGEAWVCDEHGTEPKTQHKPLRIRLELNEVAGKHWLSLLALCGYLRGVVPAELVLPGGRPA